MSATDEHSGVSVLNAIDQLRRELSSYHGQLKAYNDLKEHSEQQRRQLACLQAANEPRNRELKHYKRETSRLVVENEKLRELCKLLWAACPTHEEDCQECEHYDGANCDLYKQMEELVVEL